MTMARLPVLLMIGIAGSSLDAGSAAAGSNPWRGSASFFEERKTFEDRKATPAERPARGGRERASRIVPEAMPGRAPIRWPSEQRADSEYAPEDYLHEPAGPPGFPPPWRRPPAAESVLELAQRPMAATAMVAPQPYAGPQYGIGGYYPGPLAPGRRYPQGFVGAYAPAYGFQPYGTPLYGLWPGASPVPGLGVWPWAW